MARAARPSAQHRDRRRISAMMNPFGVCIVTILTLGLLGLPIGYSMIAGSILYLLLAGPAPPPPPPQNLHRPSKNYALLAGAPVFFFVGRVDVRQIKGQLLAF